MTASAWDDLVATALIGTERRTPRNEVTDAVAGILRAAPGESRAVESRVLEAAAVLGTWRRTGWAPATASVTGSGNAAPPDQRPVPSPAAVQLLELLLDGGVTVAGGPSALVGEWLDRCAAGGRRVPDRLLPRLLEVASRQGQLRDSAARAGGCRAVWLAGHNPAWAWAAGSVPGGDGDVEEAWATGVRDARVVLLGDLRHRDPGRARELLWSTWSTESAADRGRFLEVLGTNLSDDDEPFLEAWLDDKAKAVRATAAHLLARLPTSRLALRMADRVRPLVSVSGRVRKKLEVEFPDELDAAARRDGVVDDTAQRGLRASWLVQIVSAAPLGFWEQHLGAPPHEIVRLAGDNRDLRDGWITATLAQRNPEWAASLVDVGRQAALLEIVPPALVSTTAERLLGRALDGALSALVNAIPPPWTPDTSAAVVARVRGMKSNVGIESILATMAARLDPTVLPDIERWIGQLGDDDSTRRRVRGLAHTLSIRRTLAEEFT